MQEFWKSVKIWQSYCHKCRRSFFETQCGLNFRCQTPQRKLITRLMQFRANSWLLNWNRLSLYRLVHAGWFYGFSRTIMLCDDSRTEMAKHEICLLTWAFSHISHVHNQWGPIGPNSKSRSESILGMCLLIMHSFSAACLNIAIRYILLKTRVGSLDYIFVRDSVGLSLTTLM